MNKPDKKSMEEKIFQILIRPKNKLIKEATIREAYQDEVEELSTLFTESLKGMESMQEKPEIIEDNYKGRGRPPKSRRQVTSMSRRFGNIKIREILAELERSNK